MKIKPLKERVAALVADFERQAIAEAVAAFPNQTACAAALGISIQSLRLKQYALGLKKKGRK